MVIFTMGLFKSYPAYFFKLTDSTLSAGLRHAEQPDQPKKDHELI